jgi:hypothetical protein
MVLKEGQRKDVAATVTSCGATRKYKPRSPYLKFIWQILHSALGLTSQI